MRSGWAVSTVWALAVTSTASRLRHAARAALQVTTVLVATGVRALRAGTKRVPRMPADVPSSRTTSSCHDILGERESTGRADEKNEEMITFQCHQH